MPRNNLPSLIFMIGRVVREGFHKNAGKNAGRSGHSPLHFHTVQYVKEHGRPQIRDVARHLLITPPAATLLVEGLVKEKLLARAIDRLDRRAVRLMVTERGKKLLSRGIAQAAKRITTVFSVLTPRERKQLGALLEKVIKSPPLHIMTPRN